MTLRVPYSFVPGTKAKAQEVNANFATVMEQIDETNTLKLNKDFSNITTTAINFIKNNSSLRNLGEMVYSPIPLNDSGLKLLDGSIITKEGIYTDFVDYMSKLYGDGTDIPNYFCTEAQWQSSVTKYGACAKFVYNSTNNTVRLPKITGLIEGTTDISALGNLIEAGLPNITGTFYGAGDFVYNDIKTSGAFKSGTSYSRNDSSKASNHSYPSIAFDASRSSSLYGNSTTVQPQAVKSFIYIVVATIAKTDIQVDLDNVATDLNSKLDNDLTNMAASQSAKNTILSWGIPDYSAGIRITVTAGTTYTAPSAGIIVVKYNQTTDVANIEFALTIDNIEVIYAVGFGNNSWKTSIYWTLIDKNSVAKITKNATNASTVTFFPLKGGN